MRNEYDFKESKPNPFSERLRKPVTMNLDVETVEYFKNESKKTGIPYQNIINLYLGQCVKEDKHLTFA